MRNIGHERGMVGRSILMVMAAVALIGVQAARAAAEPVPVPADKIQALMEGTSINMKSKSGNLMTWNFGADGWLEGTVENPFGDDGEDEGRWSVNPKGRLCFQWTRWIRAQKRCPGLAVEDGDIRLMQRNGRPERILWRIERLGPAAGPIMAEAGRSPSRAQVVAAPQEPGDAILIPSKLVKPLMAGTTIETRSRKSLPMKWRFQPDGGVDGEIQAPSKTITDEGKWWATKVGTLCFQWNRFASA